MPKVAFALLLLLSPLAGCAPSQGVPSDGYTRPWPNLGPLFRQRDVANHPGN